MVGCSESIYYFELEKQIRTFQKNKTEKCCMYRQHDKLPLRLLMVCNRDSHYFPPKNSRIAWDRQHWKDSFAAPNIECTRKFPLN